MFNTKTTKVLQNSNKKLWITIVLLAVLSPSVFAQNDSIYIAQDDSPVDLVELPPLRDLIDTAILYSPLVNYYQDKIKQSEYEFLASRFDWMEETYILNETKYGQYGPGQELSQLSLGYSIGTTVKLPLTALLGRKNRKMAYSMEIEAAIHKKEEAQDVLCQIIIRQYNTVLLKRDLVSIKNTSTQTTFMHQQMAEKEFNEGMIPVSELARVTEIHTRELGEFTISKSEFKTAYMILNELVGKDFNVSNW